MPIELNQNVTKRETNRVQQAPFIEDELRSEYDLTRLRVRKVGSLRTNFGGRVLRFTFDGVEDSQCRDSK